MRVGAEVRDFVIDHDEGEHDADGAPGSSATSVSGSSRTRNAQIQAHIQVHIQAHKRTGTLHNEHIRRQADRDTGVRAYEVIHDGWTVRRASMPSRGTEAFEATDWVAGFSSSLDR